VKKPSITGFLLGSSKGGAEEDEDEDITSPSEDEYQEDLAEALGSDVTPEQVAAMKRFVQSCKGPMKGMK
jgi:hypothetical protein